MSSHSDLVKQKVEELRIKNQNEADEKARKLKQQQEEAEALRIQQEQEGVNAMIESEAEMILYFEKITDQKIISEYKVGTDPNSYISELLSPSDFRRYNSIIGHISKDALQCIIGSNYTTINRCYSGNSTCYYCNNMKSYDNYIQRYRNHPNQPLLSKHKFTLNNDIILFKIKYFHKHVSNLITPLYNEWVKKQQEQQEVAEKLRIQGIINDTNTAINNIVRNSIKHTFTNLTIADWNTRYEKQFVACSRQCVHYSVDTNNKTASPCYSGMPASFANYYEEGKVPFCTKCPTCKSLTKINYLNKIHQSGFGGCETQRSYEFTEVYCEKNHYFYDSVTNKHYVSGYSVINHQRPSIGAWQYQCWNPNLFKWCEWNPSDPDGKKAEEERKRKEADDIQKQIAELQSKLSKINV